MRYNARAGLHLFEDARTQLQIDAGQQVHRENVSVLDRRVEQVAHFELHLVANLGAGCVVGRFLDAHGVEIDAKAARSVFGGRRHQHAPVAAAKVHHEILARYFRDLKHPVHHFLRRRHVRHIEAGRWLGERGRSQSRTCGQQSGAHAKQRGAAGARGRLKQSFRRHAKILLVRMTIEISTASPETRLFASLAGDSPQLA